MRNIFTLSTLLTSILLTAGTTIAAEKLDYGRYLGGASNGLLIPPSASESAANSHYESNWFEDSSTGGHSQPPVTESLIKPVSFESFDMQMPDWSGSHAYPPAAHSGERWIWQALPDGLMYRSYIAGEKESRFGLSILNRQQSGTIWEVALGGRVGILRFGDTDTIRPQGWQLDVEGAAFPRLNQDQGQDLDLVDFRFGIPLTYRKGPWGFKIGYYHISSHVGDEFIERNPTFVRNNYVRDSFIMGFTYDIREDLMSYAEFGYAFGVSDGARPFELQFGLEWSPTKQRCVTSGPVVAANAHLREEVRMGGSINIIAGWQWRGARTSKTWRMGLQYYNGKSMQYELWEDNDTLIGLGMWYDF